jgi:hypothetical protein
VTNGEAALRKNGSTVEGAILGNRRTARNARRPFGLG